MATKIVSGPRIEGDRRVCVADVDGLVSYVAGGQVIKASQFGLKTIEHIICATSDNAGHEIAPRFTVKGQTGDAKLVWMVIGTGAEVAGAVNLSARFTRIMVIGY